MGSTKKPVTIHRGKRHLFLGIVLDFSKPGECAVTQFDYVSDMIKEWPETIKENDNSPTPASNTHRIKKELSICQSFQCPDLVRFPVLSQIKPQAPLLVVPFRQFL